jgi:hypothetical protein
MANPLERIGAMVPSHPSTLVEDAAGPAASARTGRAFREILDETSGAEPPSVIPERLRSLARSITSGERAVDRVIAQATGGRDFSTPELIAIQARVYRYTQELELVSKLVDKACTGVKQTLQTQV